jgi:glycosyltransferase involved in cell wall biosynthesis
MTTDPIGGVWRYTIDLCRELSDCAIALASMGGELRASQRDEIGKLANVSLFESPYKLEWMADPWKDVRAAGAWLYDICERVQPCLVHLNQFAHGALEWQVPCLVVGHSCVYSWYRAVKGHPPGAEWVPYRRSVMSGLRGASRVTAPSRWMLHALAENYGPFSAAAPIYNGTGTQRARDLAKEDFVLTAGRLWDEAKNIAALDRAAAHCAWPVLAAGNAVALDGRAPERRHLRLLGVLEPHALAGLMARAAIFALPARYEPFGLSVLEAGVAGCALVLGDIPSLREIWQEAALFVPPDDPDAIGAALAALIKDTAERERLARAARRRAATFTAERMAHAYRRLYGDMLAARATASARDTGARPAPL